MVYVPENVTENDTHNILWDFEIQTDYQIPARSDLVWINKKKRIWPQVNFDILNDNRVKIKESKKDGKIPGSCQWASVEYEGDCSWCTWNSSSKTRELGICERIKTAALIKSVRIWQRVLEETCCHSDFSEKPPVKTFI